MDNRRHISPFPRVLSISSYTLACSPSNMAVVSGVTCGFMDVIGVVTLTRHALRLVSMSSMNIFFFSN